jgi:hypothetical protein
LPQAGEGQTKTFTSFGSSACVLPKGTDSHRGGTTASGRSGKGSGKGSGIRGGNARGGHGVVLAFAVRMGARALTGRTTDPGEWRDKHTRPINHQAGTLRCIISAQVKGCCR